MTTKEIIEKYISFFEKQGHKQIPNVSLVPEGDSSLLFVNSGMFPIVPYLAGETHPLGKRLVSIQRSIRLQDIEEVGDKKHTVAFHMLGNWSLGDYFKKEQLNWVFQFLFDELKLDPNKIFCTVFDGDERAPKDEESISLLKDIFSRYGFEAELGKKIFLEKGNVNWWQRGDEVGELGGPDSEIHYYLGEDTGLGKDPEDYENDFLEIGNSVFMQYIKTETNWKELSQSNVDFGGGLERLAMVVQGKKDIFETDGFWPLIEKIQELSEKDYYKDEKTKKQMRILADHIRASAFICMDGVIPSNKDQGYILRRLLRRMIRSAKSLGIEENIAISLTPVVVKMFSWLYPQLSEKETEIKDIFEKEEVQFIKTLKNASKEVETYLSKIDTTNISDLAETAFNLYQSLGYPSEMFLSDLSDRGINVEDKIFVKTFNDFFEAHKSVSREGAKQKFKGGLADHSEEVIKYHTATHLLQRALKNVLGEHVSQTGCNLTGERLRFDFFHPQKLTTDEIEKVENVVNDVISKAFPVNFKVLPKEEALKTGAIYLMNGSYPDPVKVYYIGDSLENAFSVEFCGGPHVTNTSEIGGIKIYKQEKIGEGKVRIYAELKN